MFYGGVFWDKSLRGCVDSLGLSAQLFNNWGSTTIFRPLGDEDDGDSRNDRLDNEEKVAFKLVDEAGAATVVANFYTNACDAGIGGTVDRTAIICDFLLNVGLLVIVCFVVFSYCVAIFVVVWG